MESWQILSGGIAAVFAVAFGVYAGFAAFGKGPILTGSYLFLSKEEKKKADKKAEYRVLTVVCGCIAIAFALLALRAFTLKPWPMQLIWLPALFAFVYVITDGVVTKRAEKKKNRR